MIFKLCQWYNKDKPWILVNTDVMDFVEQSEWRKFDNYYEWLIQKKMTKG
jgi:hypothetical protein